MDGFSANDVGTSAALSKAANLVGATVDPCGGVGPVEERAVGLVVAGDGVHDGVGEVGRKLGSKDVGGTDATFLESGMMAMLDGGDGRRRCSGRHGGYDGVTSFAGGLATALTWILGAIGESLIMVSHPWRRRCIMVSHPWRRYVGNRLVHPWR